MSFPYIEDSFGLDRGLAAGFFHAMHGETVSTKAAQAARDGKPWACRFCALLSVVVEKDHCGKVLSSDLPTAAHAAIRAGIALWFGVALPFTLLCWAGWSLVFSLVRWVF